MVNWKLFAAASVSLMLCASGIASCAPNANSTQPTEHGISSGNVATTHAAKPTPTSYPSSYSSVPGTLRSKTSGVPLIAVTDCEVSSETQTILGSTYRLAIASGEFLGAVGGDSDPGMVLTLTVFDSAGNDITLEQVTDGTTDLSQLYFHGNRWQAEALISTGFKPASCNVDLSSNG